MDEKIEWLKCQIEEWKENKIIDKKTSQKIIQFYSENKNPKEKLRTSVILSIIAAVLISAGIISLIAYNWVIIGRGAKTVAAFLIAMLPAVICFLPVLAPNKFKNLEKTFVKEFFSCLWLLMCGACIEFLAQIYLLPLSSEALALFWFSLALLIYFCTACKGVYAFTLFLYICATRNYFLLSSLIVVFFLFSNYLFINNHKNEKRVYAVIYSLLASVFFILFMVLRILISDSDNQDVEISYAFFQIGLLIAGSILGLIYFMLGLKKIWKNKTYLFPALETFILVSFIAGGILMSYFSCINIKTISYIVEISFTILIVFASVRIIYYKLSYWKAFVFMGLIFISITGFVFLQYINIFGSYFIFLCICLSMFLYNKKIKTRIMTTRGKVIFALAIFIGIFEIYGISPWYNKNYYEKNPLIYHFIYTFGLFYLLGFGILRPLLKSIREKKAINYAIPVFGLINFIYLFLIQFYLNKSLLKILEISLPLLALISVVIFSVIEIIYWYKKNSIIGINLSGIYFLFVIFIKFFISTNSLIARGLVFIFLGIIVLVTNLVLSNNFKIKGGRIEE